MALPPANTGPLAWEDAIEEQLLACARDERPALESLYQLTASRVHALAVAGSATPEAAEQALIQTYLDAFAEAGSFRPGEHDAAAWLDAILARHVPNLHLVTPGAFTDPPPELWQRLDIAIGLKRLGRHIRPGVATMERGRDPMPNELESTATRKLAFWRVTALGALALIAAAITVLAVPALRESAAGLLATALPGTLVASAAPAPRATILRPGGESRVWRLALDGGGLGIEAFPAFAREGKGSLVLWALPETGEKPVRLGPLDPEATTRLDLPDGLAAAALGFVITLEPEDGAVDGVPTGRTLFSGRLEP